MSFTPNATIANTVGAAHNGGLITDAEPIVNFVDSGTVTFTVTDDPGNGRTNVTADAAGGGGSAPTMAALPLSNGWAGSLYWGVAGGIVYFATVGGSLDGSSATSPTIVEAADVPAEIYNASGIAQFQIYPVANPIDEIGGYLLSIGASPGGDIELIFLRAAGGIVTPQSVFQFHGLSYPTTS